MEGRTYTDVVEPDPFMVIESRPILSSIRARTWEPWKATCCPEEHTSDGITWRMVMSSCRTMQMAALGLIA